MKLCYLCVAYVETPHDCPKAKEMEINAEEAERNGTRKNEGPWIAMAARPTRTMA